MTDQKNKEEQRKYYEKRRDDFEKIRSDSIDSFDKALLQLSAGVLILTITFIDKIGKPYDNFTNILLIIFLSLFLAVISVNIFSYISAQKNMDFKIANLDDRYEECPDNWQSVPEQFSNWKKCTEYCNYLALVLFLAGIILFMVYAYKIQTHNYQMIDKKEGTIMAEDKKVLFKDGKTESSEKQPIKKVEPVKVPEKTKK